MEKVHAALAETKEGAKTVRGDLDGVITSIGSIGARRRANAAARQRAVHAKRQQSNKKRAAKQQAKLVGAKEAASAGNASADAARGQNRSSSSAPTSTARENPPSSRRGQVLSLDRDARRQAAKARQAQQAELLGPLVHLFPRMRKLMIEFGDRVALMYAWMLMQRKR